MPEKIRVVGAAIVQGDRCLAAKRGPGMSLEGHWEFPGGKVELGETLHSALKRELLEELDIEIEVGREIGRGQARHGMALVELIVFLARLRGGTVRPREHSDIGWFHAAELFELPWAAADAPVVPLVARLLEERQRH